MILPLLIVLQVKASVPATAVQVHVLPKAAFVVDHEFAQVRGLRELPDGRVLVADRLEEQVFIIQPKTGAALKLGRAGSGPAEYHYPTGIVATPGDSSVLIDEGNSRIAIIGPDLKIARSFTLIIPGVPLSSGPRGRDAAGKYLATIPGWFKSRGPLKDTIDIVRLDYKTQRVDTVAAMRGYTPSGITRHETPGFPMVAFTPQDVWTVAPDGSIAIVCSADYHVDWIATDGKVTRGPPVRFTPIKVTAEDKMIFVRRFSENAGMSGKGQNGGVGLAPPEFRSEAALKQMIASNEFAQTKGPFTDASPVAGGDGRLWVERTVLNTAPPIYDAFNRRGEHILQVQLPKDRRLIGVGKSALYALHVDADGVEHLEVFQLP